MILEVIVSISVMFTGSSCAAIDNGGNTAVWQQLGHAPVRTSYTDLDRIRYEDAPGAEDNGAWNALHRAEDVLSQGPAGHRIAVACA